MSRISLDKELIKDLSDLLEKNNLSEITVTQGRHSVKVARQFSSEGIIDYEIISKGDKKTIKNNNKDIEDIEDAGAVKSPMVGTVYLASAPGAKPFISVGKSVKEGDQLFIIEAMKTMNPVKSPYNGIIKKIIVKNEAPVEYDEVLASIEIS